LLSQCAEWLKRIRGITLHNNNNNNLLLLKYGSSKFLQIVGYKLTLNTASYSRSLLPSGYGYTADLSRLEVIELDYVFSVQNLTMGTDASPTVLTALIADEIPLHAFVKPECSRMLIRIPYTLSSSQ
jgi:hypothetical protein